MTEEKRSLAGDLVKGAVAGALGVWALDRVTWFMWNREEPEALAREEAARPLGLDPAHLVAHKIHRQVDREAEPKQPSAGGLAVHYSLGVVPGALYSALRHRWGASSAVAGAAFGVGLFLLQDVLLNRLLGLSGPARDYPWQAYARGFVGHAVFGATTDLALRAMDGAVPGEGTAEQAHAG